MDSPDPTAPATDPGRIPFRGGPPARHRLALVVDPRFPGGTAAAVAAEVRALAGRVDLRLFALETAMFKGRRLNPVLEAALEDAGLAPIWGAPVIHADTVVFHNPSCLRFDAVLEPRISCTTALVVTHENFLRPDGSEGFDVAGCLEMIEAALVCGRRHLAPISQNNRAGVLDWLEATGSAWTVTDFDWFNICDFELVPPVAAPRDRRGRHSRSGFEKFPPMETMLAHFPAHAAACTILGGDILLADAEAPPPRHWTIRRFGEMDVANFLRELDFFVYFTNPRWRESFGRVIAEAIAAGKLVITDPATARTFGEAVVASDGGDVDDIIAEFVADPDRYRDFVIRAQSSLGRFSPEAFAGQVLARVAAPREAPADALL